MKLLQLLNEIEVRNIRTYRITVGDKTIAVYPEDLGKMKWKEAIKACKKLGPEWRLPTLREFLEIYKQLHIEGKGNFENDTYWFESGDYLNMSNGMWSYCNYITKEHRVSLVRTPERKPYTHRHT